jgi:hypothetical protein
MAILKKAGDQPRRQALQAAHPDLSFALEEGSQSKKRF